MRCLCQTTVWHNCKNQCFRKKHIIKSGSGSRLLVNPDPDKDRLPCFSGSLPAILLEHFEALHKFKIS
jgi:hypothetical protein